MRRCVYLARTYRDFGGWIGRRFRTLRYAPMPDIYGDLLTWDL